MRRSIVATAGAVLVATLLTACVAAPVAPPPVVASSPPTSTTTPPQRPPVQTESIRDSCQAPYLPYDPASPPYSGSPPHPVAVYVVSDSTELVTTSPAVIAEVEAPDLPNYEPDPAQVQLLACVLPRPARGGDAVTITCSSSLYAGTTEFRLVGGSYLVQVREARTGALVGAFPVSATQGDLESCPAGPPAFRVQTLLRGIDNASFRTQLLEYANATR